MIPIPNTRIEKYLYHLNVRGITVARNADYVKWLRYFLDFCEKYQALGTKSERVRLFMNKLREKNQPEERRRQAAHAVSLYFEIQNDEVCSQSEENREGVVAEVEPLQGSVKQGSSHYCEAGYQEKSDSPEWDEVLEKLAEEIKVRHYSRKTLKTYALWSRQFQRFLKNKPPQELSTTDVKEYLTYLAVKCHVAASTQNQAFNSLLFLYRHALKREFGELRGVLRASRRP